MKIIFIRHINKTAKEDFTEITFKPFFGKPFKAICITPNWNLGTDFAQSGKSIPVVFWDAVKSFIRTRDKFHNYQKNKSIYDEDN